MGVEKVADFGIERSQVAVIKTMIDCCAKQEIEAGGIAKVCQ